MKLKVLKKTGNEIKIEIEGEGHSFCNALQKVLLEEEVIDIAGYNLPHPLTANPVVFVRTLKGRPETALRNAAEKLQKKNKQFNEAFEKALKEWQQK
ncbi:MAG: RpoL/Rpb11 RNA polymerase subunit family protein [Candidatus Bathyarchaeia archaeon]|nr:DNA-directed RNA polymerase subunit L [Candidatus Bathyarchaeota archaeon A05DMB-4]MDH7595280.1 DNA-directed RNA polymerase subunit L [Candidatus Bathyarchaeota archaeon]